MALSDDEIDRYQRHILLPEIGGAGQQKLKAASVLLVGMGGLGHPVGQYLAAAGIGHLGLVDDDVVELSNLQRQVLFSDSDLGSAKVAAAGKALKAVNPHVRLRLHETRLTQVNCAALLADYDLVVDGTDNFATRFIVNDGCYTARKTLVSGAVGRFDGQVATFKPWLKDADGTPLPCYRSLVPQVPEAQDNCATTGIIGALTGVIGAFMAVEVIKEITGAGDSLAGHMLIYDGLAGAARRVKIAWDPANPNNGRDV
ncbi:MAG: HesA/MoeB/ThiF family protein [Parvibaculales bacterium]